MYKIEGTTISMVRGDTFVAAITLNRNGEPYIPTENDTIRFAAKRQYGDLQPCIQKEVPTDTMELKLNPSDTAKLPFGTYIYDLEIEFEDGGVDTFVASGKLNILNEVCSA